MSMHFYELTQLLFESDKDLREVIEEFVDTEYGVPINKDQVEELANKLWNLNSDGYYEMNDWQDEDEFFDIANEIIYRGRNGND